ncbi:Lanthionine biosynthesis protein LanM [Myxococcus hansupus]|uniref:Lanthionine biosynthesis protein LanM n=1 Tax=Pseudomyxococcus hansupus TaxID=1297742 RepID=A0A0H4WNS7_9BACT|nr:type 2 lanthipeptide synthetase LanM family protein [Myxococcus hansupus]AKQ64444.1 Lanthionine biosynthesis protein LanM [Myxococcus hansupus]
MSEARMEEAAVRRIAARASTLWERLEGGYVPEDDPESLRLASERLGRWRDKAAGGDARLFQKRLDWLGTSSRQVLPLLGEVRLEGALPAWTRTFRRAMALRREAGQGGQGREIPFVELLRPFAEVARELLSFECQAVFTDAAFDDLMEDLLRELSHVAAPALLAEFVAFRSSQGGRAEPTSRALYEAFIARQLAEGPREFFTDYAVLARLLSRVTEQWALHVNALASAVKADREEMQRVFTEGAPLGRIVAIQSSLSDRHLGGRTVAHVTFEGGTRLYFKPRGLGVEVAWYELLAALNARGGDFHLLRVLDRGTWGWVEPAVPAPCADASEVRRFYVRSGMLLSLLYVLEASDCFFENIVAAGAFPVLIDTETLMHHVLHQRRDGGEAEALAKELVLDSVCRAGFLPSWDVGPRGERVDISGLGATPGQVTGYLRRQWHHINTDAMGLEQVPIRLESEDHLPRLGGELPRVSEHAGALVEGFSWMYRQLREHRQELSQPGSPLARLGSQEIRFVFHASRIYGLLLKRLGAPRHLRVGVERSIETDVLSRFYVESPEKTRYWPLLAAELESLEQLDLPCFRARADSHALTLPTGHVLSGAFLESGRERAWRKLSSLDEADLESQVRFIHAALSLGETSRVHAPASRPRQEESGQDDAPLSREELAAEANAIAAGLRARAILTPGGGATWIAPRMVPDAGHHPLSPLRLDLYDGLGGIALFHAGMEHVCGEGREMALAALSSLRRFVASATPRRAAQEGYPLGAASGLGSFLYVLCRASSLLGEPSLLEDASRAASLITPEAIEADDQFDAVSGTAGALLGLLVFHQATGLKTALERARQCGAHLLRHQHPCEPAGAAWSARKGRPVTGLAHGAAGIALALLRLDAVVGDSRLRVAAERALAFEASDFRQAREGALTFTNTWCHGAAGVGLARLSGLSLLDSSAVRRDIDDAVSRARQQGLGERDGVCCGQSGVIELLLTAARSNADAALDALALRQASAMVRRARTGGYRFAGAEQGGFPEPAFFQGLSGLGYQLLRLAFPGRLPSVLVWE